MSNVQCFHTKIISSFTFYSEEGSTEGLPLPELLVVYGSKIIDVFEQMIKEELHSDKWFKSRPNDVGRKKKKNKKKK